jgi:MATE family multidrug resistance protein
MWTNIGMLVFNVFLNYVLIFGRLGFPEMGIKGAALSSVLSSVLNFIIYFSIIIFKKGYRQKYNSLSAWRFNPKLIFRLIKYGFPNGLQFFLDMIGITIFVFLVGRMGTVSLAATNIAFNISNFSFMPMIGFGIAISILVGRAIGAKDVESAEFCTYSGFHMTFLYMVTIALLFIIVPKIFIMPFAANVDMDVANYKDMFADAIILLRFVAFYCIFDTMNIIFGSAIKGAGDTRFVVIVIGLLTVFLMIIPSYFGIFVFKLSLIGVWVIPTLYAVVLGFIFLMRFRHGAWKRMSVIEHH